MLEFVSRLRGQTITTVVERAISAAADQATWVEDGGFRQDPIERSWRDFWSVNEGERALSVAGAAPLHPSYEEERRLVFAKKHWAFFYTSIEADIVRSAYLEILWPRIDEYIALDEERKTEDFWAAAKAMQQAIRAAGVVPPDWPVTGTKRPSTKAPAFNPPGDDDDIPF